MTEEQRYQELYASLTKNDAYPYAGTLLQRAATAWPERTALICQNRTITYYELYHKAQALRAQLHEKNIKKNDRVIIIYENSIPYYAIYFAIWHLGAVVVPVNTLLHEQEIAHIIKDAQPALCVTSPTLASKIPATTATLVLSELDFNNLVMHTDMPLETKEDHELAALLYTSGTTGFPKGVMLSSRNILSNTIQAIARFTFSGQERVYGALPLFHSMMQNTCIWSSFMAGACVILVPKIDRTNLREGLSYKPTIIVGIPALYALFCRFKNCDFSDIRYFFVGGDALPDKIRMYFSLLYNRALCNGYGLTETSPAIAVHTEEVLDTCNNIGKPLCDITCELRTEQGAVRYAPETNEYPIGTLWVSGDNIMLGYYNAPEATAAVLQDGWLNTGDLATFDQHGNLVICGRERDLIINKGVKIYPQEVENVLMSHPLVMMAAVIGCQNNNEEVPVAYIVVTENKDGLEIEIKQFCESRIASYKVPRTITIKKELPVTTTGKVNKKQLKIDIAQDTQDKKSS